MKKFIYVAFLLGALLQSSFAAIKANDVLTISIQGVPAGEQARLSSQYQVSSTGYITMWTIGAVKAAGKSQSRLANDIAAAYRQREIYTNPTFQVIAKSGTNLSQKTFTVGGQVKAAGPKPYANNMTIFDAVQAAGGPTAFGAMNRVKLHRGGRVQELNLKQDRVKLMRLREGDTVEVPEKDWRGQ